MAKITLQEQAIDRTKPFTLGYYEGDRYVEKLTYPLKQSVERIEKLGLTAPWEVR
jgi:hypothetical protein